MSETPSQDATARRRKLARDEGRAARSSDLSAAVVVLVLAVVLAFLGQSRFALLTQSLQDRLRIGSITPDGAWAEVENFRQVALEIVVLLLPLLLVIPAASISSQIAQTGFLLLPRRIVPSARRLSLTRGMSRWFSMASVVDFMQLVLKTVALVSVTTWILWRQVPHLATLSSMEVPDVARYAGSLAAKLFVAIGLVSVALGLLDYGLQHWIFERSLRMTPQELWEEIRAIRNDLNQASRRSPRPQVKPRQT